MKGRNSKVVPGMEEKTEKHKLLGFILCPVLVGGIRLHTCVSHERRCDGM